MTSVVVLDGNQRSALAATRALGSRGISVIAADEITPTLAGCSRYCTGVFTYPPPSRGPEEFIAAVRRGAADCGASVIFPMSDVTSHLLVQGRQSLHGVSIPLGSPAALDALQDKWALYQLARRLNVPVPRTCAAGPSDELASVAATLRFPVVVKPRRSRTWTNGTCVAGAVSYAFSYEELGSILNRDPHLSPRDYLIQEYISGESQGVFALYANGAPVTFFAHRRLREKPPSGGVSVLSESIAVDPRLRELARRILDEVGWHGVAMLEFKVASDGTPYLIEANPRFWGSLQLAIDAGVNFPYLLYQVAVGAPPRPAAGYHTGIRSRWLLGDVDHLYLTLRGHPGPNLRPRSKWRALAAFLRFFDRTTRYEINRSDDLRPFLLEIRRYLRRVA